MARTTQPKDILSRFADLGEEAMQKLADVPGATRLAEITNQSKHRIDEIQKRLRGLDVLERRVDELEARLAALETTPKSSAKSGSSASARTGAKSGGAKPAATKKAASKSAAAASGAKRSAGSSGS